MGGGDAARPAPAGVPLGPSPRGRGRPRRRADGRVPTRSIPAWAGATPRACPVASPRGVHPRVGGGDPRVAVSGRLVDGPSPRGRGRQRGASVGRHRRGSIPAWAGATPARCGLGRAAGVHPRVGGGDDSATSTRVRAEGPSPRGRGRRQRDQHPRAGRGSIPAWAGATASSGASPRPSRVHPRVGGGDASSTAKVGVPSGPSPRGRGRPRANLLRVATHRSIPAWAGATGRRRRGWWPDRVHPRVGGGDTLTTHCITSAGGPSPRGRGRPHRGEPRQCRDGSIPAWAGATMATLAATQRVWVHPRVGGGDISSPNSVMAAYGPSPRGRGRHRDDHGACGRHGSIPAWAGATGARPMPAGANTVHPRVGGGDTRCFSSSRAYRGPSPRGRGRRGRYAEPPGGGRSIPAWAGATPSTAAAPSRGWVHPRVGGGDCSTSCARCHS